MSPLPAGLPSELATLVAVLLAGLGAWAWHRPSVLFPVGRRDRPAAEEQSLLVRHRALLSLLAGSAGLSFVDPPWGWAAGAAGAGTVWVVAGRAEPPGVRRAREETRRELPHVVQLLAVALASGASIPSALEQVADALPGAASESLRLARARLALGASPAQVWQELAGQPGLEPLGRALARSDAAGVRVADTIERLGRDLATEARLEVEDRARSVGIRAALPLGVCLLPAFLLVGIVPVVAAAVSALEW